MISPGVESGEWRPRRNITALIVAGYGAGAMVAVAPFAMDWVGVPPLRPFLPASRLLGILCGRILRFKHR